MSDGSHRAARGRLAREEKTIIAMVEMYCRAHHGARGLCAECGELVDYALLRLERCRYGAGKPTCANCSTHCYRPDMRERIRTVMRYSGPRMLRRHPVLAVAHLIEGRRAPADAERRRPSERGG